MKNFKLVTASLLATTALTVPDMAIAQTNSFEDEVIVTATRRAESIQDVPIAVTAILPDDLEKQGVVNIQNLTSVAPSFSTSQAQTASGTVVLRIRGVGTTSNNIGFESAVGVFIDGAYQSRPGVALGEFVDVERVEVLRGPQGTLFGRNTSAGALNVINTRPDLNEAGGFINATYGNFNHQNLQGAVNIPLAEGKVAARLTGAYRKRDGIIDLVDGAGNDIGDSNNVDQFMLRGQIGFESDRGIKGRVIVDHSSSDAVCCAAVEVQRATLETPNPLLGGLNAFQAVGFGVRAGMAGPVVAIDSTDTALAEQAVENRIGSASFRPDPNNSQSGIVAEIEVPVSDNADLIYIGSYRDYEAEEAYDSDFSGLDIFNVLSGSLTNISTLTQEVRLQGDAMDDRLSWLVGAYYSEEDITQNVNFGLGTDYDRLVGALFSGAAGPAPLALFSGGTDASSVRTTNDYAQDSTSWSVFTHNIFDITDALSLTVGLRYSDESKDGSYSQSSVNNPVCPAILSNILGAPPVGAPPAPPLGTALGNGLFGLGCLAFVAPADLPAALAGVPLPRSFSEEFNDDELIYTGKIGYEFTPDITTYASYTHGYKSGGFNLDSTAAIPVAGVSDPSFRSETVDAFELGLKSKWMDGRVTLNVAAFLENFEDFQVLEFTGAQFQTFNVPKAETKGIEIEAAAQPTDNLSFNGGLTILDASYPDDCAGADQPLRVQNLCGFELTNAPKTVGLLGATYTGDLSDSFNFFLNGQIRYEGDRRTSTQGRLVPGTAADLGNTPLNPFDIQESTFKLNLRAGIGSEDHGWGLEAWATNITDEVTRGVTFNTVLRGTSRSAFLQEPRMYGVTARKTF